MNISLSESEAGVPGYII